MLSEIARPAGSSVHGFVVCALISFFLALTFLPALAQSDSDAIVYRLGTGDKLRVIVFGEEDLSGEFVVDGSGFIRLPLIGQVQAANRTVYELERDVEEKLKDGYLKIPRVSLEVMNYRPFYIIGEVNKPGEYPYVNGMSVLNAVALAGGYTYRANESSVHLRRYGDSREQSVPADETTKVYPGDIIRVVERFF
ncbi:MAG: polysaccharide biosynthesis/export family protein [Alphaproteobacteria bacterium]